MRVTINVDNTLYEMMEKQRDKLVYKVSRSEYYNKAFAYLMGVEEDYRARTGAFAKRYVPKQKPKKHN